MRMLGYCGPAPTQAGNWPGCVPDQAVRRGRERAAAVCSAGGRGPDAGHGAGWGDMDGSAGPRLRGRLSGGASGSRKGGPWRRRAGGRACPAGCGAWQSDSDRYRRRAGPPPGAAASARPGDRPRFCRRRRLGRNRDRQARSPSPNRSAPPVSRAPMRLMRALEAPTRIFSFNQTQQKRKKSKIQHSKFKVLLQPARRFRGAGVRA